MLCLHISANICCSNSSELSILSASLTLHMGDAILDAEMTMENIEKKLASLSSFRHRASAFQIKTWKQTERIRFTDHFDIYIHYCGIKFGLW